MPDRNLLSIPIRKVYQCQKMRHNSGVWATYERFDSEGEAFDYIAHTEDIGEWRVILELCSTIAK